MDFGVSVANITVKNGSIIEEGVPRTNLPTPCDLSQTSLIYALRIGENLGYGVPKKLLSTPEDRAVAKALVATNTLVLNGGKLEYEMNCFFPERHWEVLFERGVVESQGPEKLEGY